MPIKEEGYRPTDKLDQTNPPNTAIPDRPYLHFINRPLFPELYTGKEDPANPKHYRTGGIEQCDYNRAKMTSVQYEGWLLGDLMKYVGRYNHKHEGAKQIDDLKKARWYLERLIAFKEEKLAE